MHSLFKITQKCTSRGGSRGGCTRCAPPLKLEKIWFFGIKSWFFTRNTPKIFAPLNTGSAPDELVLLVCFSTVDNMNLLIWSNPIHYKKSMQFHIFIIELQYQYLNYIPGIPVLTILEQIFILVIAKYRRSRYSTLLVTKFIHKTSRHSQCSDFSTTCKMNVLVLS